LAISTTESIAVRVGQGAGQSGIHERQGDVPVAVLAVPGPDERDSLGVGGRDHRSVRPIAGVLSAVILATMALRP